MSFKIYNNFLWFRIYRNLFLPSVKKIIFTKKTKNLYLLQPDLFYIQTAKFEKLYTING
ncbi:hypothetical protein CHAB381_0814 [Campylobacter hominis ATCC BAA-381]|uniref:Uncharacterized protein n=1 Tax=Campylobacter hominis (strain ATCC BAA-381 / DSM 21671 / CCUG 45161 / LMG 19568 / NCTC 13146 / CH001A) TaxID=360107 RepID=A7I1J0_CAMHC|nr:hypothetical protein CHAB381_0814 [Campylobacter hominis ATCC BAA-381]